MNGERELWGEMLDLVGGRFIYEGFCRWIVFVNKVEYQERLVKPGDCIICIKDHVFNILYWEE